MRPGQKNRARPGCVAGKQLPRPNRFLSRDRQDLNLRPPRPERGFHTQKSEIIAGFCFRYTQPATDIARLASLLININAIPKNLEYEDPVLSETSTQVVWAFNSNFIRGPFECPAPSLRFGRKEISCAPSSNRRPRRIASSAVVNYGSS